MIDLLQNKSEREILALTIYGEARGEYEHRLGGLAALIAVGNVVCNRLLHPERFGHTIKAVCFKKWQFSCWNDTDPNREMLMSETFKVDPLYHRALHVAENIIDQQWPDLTKGANHYFANWLSKLPTWAQGKKPTVQIGQHLFYNI